MVAGRYRHMQIMRDDRVWRIIVLIKDLICVDHAIVNLSKPPFELFTLITVFPSAFFQLEAQTRELHSAVLVKPVVLT